jgi:hypothetical protein
MSVFPGEDLLGAVFPSINPRVSNLRRRLSIKQTLAHSAVCCRANSGSGEWVLHIDQFYSGRSQLRSAMFFKPATRRIPTGLRYSVRWSRKVKIIWCDYPGGPYRIAGGSKPGRRPTPWGNRRSCSIHRANRARSDSHDAPANPRCL